MSEKNLIEARLQQALTNKTPLALLINGKQRITGLVRAFDAHMVLMDCGRTTQMVYRHAITDLTEATVATGRVERPASLRNQAPSRGNDRKRDDRREDRPREKKSAPAPSAHKQKQEQQTSQPQTPASPMTGALGEELRKWLQRTSG